LGHLPLRSQSSFQEFTKHSPGGFNRVRRQWKRKKNRDASWRSNWRKLRHLALWFLRMNWSGTVDNPWPLKCVLTLDCCQGRSHSRIETATDELDNEQRALFH
jgi:hypothetical protein